MGCYGHIYKITNLINGKVYIGQTTKIDPNKRVYQHFTGANNCRSLVSKSIKKHGRTNFEAILLVAAFNKKDLDHLEDFFIKEYNSIVPNGYNLIGGGITPGKWSTVSREKLSKSLQKWHSKNTILVSDKTRKLMSKLRKGFTSPARIVAFQKVKEGLMKEVKVTNIKTKEVYIFKNTQVAAQKLGLTSSCISRVCRGDQNRRQHKGYTFEYTKDKSNNPLPLLDKTKSGIYRVKNKYGVVINKKYLGCFLTENDAIKAKTLYLQNEQGYKQFIKELLDNKRITLWKKRI